MNKAELLGRVTKDPVINYTQGEKSMCVARFTLAVQRKYKRDEADFISCVVFGKVAEIVEKYVKKGSQICVAGHIQTGSFMNREGNKVFTTDVVVEDMDLCGNRSENTQKAAPTGEANYQQMRFGQPVPSESVGDGFMSIPDGIDEELPFMP